MAMQLPFGTQLALLRSILTVALLLLPGFLLGLLSLRALFLAFEQYP